MLYEKSLAGARMQAQERVPLMQAFSKTHL